MNTNHNRIKVADLEVNDPDKILITNDKGELEFDSIKNIKVDSYNALDYTAEGKVLDARQGKNLKDLIDDINLPIASNSETQIATVVPEDKKVVSRLKLFNWWIWIKSQVQTIPASWTFNSNLFLGTAGYLTSNTFALFLRARGGKQIQIGIDGIMTALMVIDPNGVEINQTVTFPAGTTLKPPILLRNGALTTVPQNGAIEKDTSGILYHTFGSSRFKILDTRDSISTHDFLSTTWRSSSVMALQLPGVNINSTLVKEVPIPSNTIGNNDYGTYLFKTCDEYLINNNLHTLTSPTSILFEVYLKGNNCKFSGNRYVRLYSVARTDINSKFSIRNNEIAIITNMIQGGGNIYSGLKYSELTYDNVGNISQETFRQYNLQSSTYSGQNGDLKLSEASISIEYRISVVFADAENINLQNSSVRPTFYNHSSLFLNLR